MEMHQVRYFLAVAEELVVYALPGEEPDERTHVPPLFRERMVMASSRSFSGR